MSEVETFGEIYFEWLHENSQLVFFIELEGLVCKTWLEGEPHYNNNYSKTSFKRWFFFYRPNIYRLSKLLQKWNDMYHIKKNSWCKNIGENVVFLLQCEYCVWQRPAILSSVVSFHAHMFSLTFLIKVTFQQTVLSALSFYTIQSYGSLLHRCTYNISKAVLWSTQEFVRPMVLHIVLWISYKS